MRSVITNTTFKQDNLPPGGFGDFNQSLKIFDAAPIGMAISDLNGILLMANDSFCQTIGYSAEEVVGKSFAVFTHPDDLEINIKRNEEVKIGMIESHQMEKRYITKQGDILHAIMKVTTLDSNESSSPKYLLAQVMDITDKVQLLQEKEQSEKEFREIFEEASIAMVHTNANLKIIKSNKSACSLLEYRCKELTGRNLAEFSFNDDLSNAVSKRDIKQGSANYTIEKRYITKSGKILDTILKVSYLKDHEILCQMTDISSLKEYERILKSKFLELKKVNQELDRFIYRASHDLKGPVATLKGLINLEEVQSMDRKIRDGFHFSVQKLENIIRELVEFSDNSQNEVVTQEFDIEKIINESIDVLRFHPNYPKIRFIKNIENNNGFRGDLRRLKPILNNLLINAIDYSDHLKDQPFVKLSVRSKNGYSEFHIEDNGIGMGDEVRLRAFDMFYRGSEISKGSGLGLYLVKETLAKMNGSVTLSSEPGKGTSVSVVFPVSA